VNVQLIEAGTGAHLWADRFDTQDEIVARHANALNRQLMSAEAGRAEQA
jgi:TolB-like protein